MRTQNLQLPPPPVTIRPSLLTPKMSPVRVKSSGVLAFSLILGRMWPRGWRLEVSVLGLRNNNRSKRTRGAGESGPGSNDRCKENLKLPPNLQLSLPNLWCEGGWAVWVGELEVGGLVFVAGPQR